MAMIDKSAAKPHFNTPEGPDRVWRVAEGGRVEEILLARLGDASRESVRRALAAGACAVDGVRRHYGFRVEAGAELTLAGWARITEVRGEEIALRVLYEDDDLIAIDKPAGMLAHPTSRERTGTVINALKGMGYREAFALHRLDRGTSGVLLAAKRGARGAGFTRLFETRRMEKRYLAVLTGAVAWETRVVEAPVGRDGARRPAWNVLEGGAAAETRLRVLERGADWTLVEAEPVTGRTNQIRIHCAWIGAPLRGDEGYGGAAADRLYLHAARLAFERGDGKRVEIEAERPAGFGGA